MSWYALIDVRGSGAARAGSRFCLSLDSQSAIPVPLSSNNLGVFVQRPRGQLQVHDAAGTLNADFLKLMEFMKFALHFRRPHQKQAPIRGIDERSAPARSFHDCIDHV